MTHMPKPLTTAQDRLRETSPRSLLNLRMVGFALARAWVYLMFLGTATSSITWNGEPLPAGAYLGSTLVLCATLFASAIFHRRFATLINRRAFRFLGPALTTVGTLALACATLPDAPSIELCALGSILTGAGSGLIDLGYGELYRNVDPRRTSFEAPLAFLIAAALFPAVLALPPVGAYVICALLPAISGWILFVKLKTWSSKIEPIVQPFEIHLGKFSWKIGICACLIGMADGVVRAVFITANAATVDTFYRFPLLWSSLLTIAIIYGCVLFSSKTGLRPVYRSVMLVMAVFFMLLPVFTGFSEIESTIALAGYGTFNVLIWILLADISFTYRLSGIMVFGIGWGMVTLGVLLGSSLGQFVCAFAPFSPQSLSLIALMATLAILISYMFVFNENDLIALAKGDEDKDEAEPKRQRFQDRCKDVAGEYGLSPKETEIMILFAKGRSSTRIQEELYLSRGTVTTHLRHIYQKMDVHGKQEFLDVIEGRE